jgi:hypothetical protein
VSERSQTSLATLQKEFAAFLHSQDGIPGATLLTHIAPGRATAAERLRVYRQTSCHSQQAALQAAYPVVAALIGASLFAALCHDYLQQPGSRSGDLHTLGAGFAETVQAEPACADYPFLPDVAALEWVVHRAFFAADAPEPPTLDLARIVPEEFSRLRLLLPPGLSLLRSATPAATIWAAHQPEAPTDALAAIDPNAGPQHLAIHRRLQALRIELLAPREYALLLACQQGLGLEAALEVLSAPLPDLAEILPRWLRLGLVLGFALDPLPD